MFCYFDHIVNKHMKTDFQFLLMLKLKDYLIRVIKFTIKIYIII